MAEAVWPGPADPVAGQCQLWRSPDILNSTGPGLGCFGVLSRRLQSPGYKCLIDMLQANLGPPQVGVRIDHVHGLATFSGFSAGVRPPLGCLSELSVAGPVAPVGVGPWRAPGIGDRRRPRHRLSRARGTSLTTSICSACGCCSVRNTAGGRFISTPATGPAPPWPTTTPMICRACSAWLNGRDIQWRDK